MDLGGLPNSWIVFLVENPNLKWMITGSIPILGNPQMGVLYGIAALAFSQYFFFHPVLCMGYFIQ